MAFCPVERRAVALRVALAVSPSSGAVRRPVLRLGRGHPPLQAHDSQPASPATCYPAGMAKLFGDDWPVSSRPAKLVICVIVFALGIAAGAAIAMWVMPPS